MVVDLYVEDAMLIGRGWGAVLQRDLLCACMGRYEQNCCQVRCACVVIHY